MDGTFNDNQLRPVSQNAHSQYNSVTVYRICIRVTWDMQSQIRYVSYTDLNCFEKLLKMSFSISHKTSIFVRKYEKLRSDPLSAVLYHWFPDIYTKIALFQDTKQKSCQNSQSERGALRSFEKFEPEECFFVAVQICSAL